MDQFTIIQIDPLDSGQHPVQSQSGRAECWLEGWIAVPDELVDAAWACGGFCDLEITGGVLTGLTPREAPASVTAPAEITALKQELAETDYQIIKCSEASLAGEAMPYDVAALHAQRQAIRDQINELEAQL